MTAPASPGALDGDRIHFPGLNGLRALAAISVLLSHADRGLDEFGMAPGRGTQLASAGVTIFFTLSGFLITYLLLVEKQRTGTVAIKAFYVRRILRIWPLYFFYFALSLALSLTVFGHELASQGALILYLIFLPNIAHDLELNPPNLGHFWSIGVEEQFYAFWPLVVKKAERLLRFLALLVALVIIVRLATFALSRVLHDARPFNIATAMRFDCMAIGAAFAFGHHRGVPWLARLKRGPWVPAIFWVTVVLLGANLFRGFSLFTDDVIAVITGAYILSLVSSTRRISLLENPLMSYLGKISYGIYVYHPLVITGLAWLLARMHVSLTSKWLVLPAVLFATILVAGLSFRWLERPFLRRKERFAVVSSSQ